jgi:hypothetical protein
MTVSLNTEFEFEIGQIVYFRFATHNLDTYPIPYIVESQRAEWCTGGVQRNYKLCNVANYAAEIALTAEMPPFHCSSNERIAEYVRQQTAVDTERDRLQEVRWRRRREQEKQETERKSTDANPS